jgi:prepilin-type N-terminal cleavage/methylation domain-containing protein
MKKKQVQKAKAFSLIEISFCLIVIAILAAAIFQSKNLVSTFRLNSAQSLTNSSPVNSIQGLVLWLEPTMPESFLQSQTSDGVQITQWNDINNQASKKYFALATASNGITYKEISEIYLLPSIYFSGSTSSLLELSKNESSLSSTPILTPNNDFTFFVVSKLNAVSNSFASSTIFLNGNSAGWGFAIGGTTNSGKRQIKFLGAGATDNNSVSASSSTKAEIISATYLGSSQTTKLFTNGALENLTSSGGIISNNPSNNFYIGNSSAANPWQGYISEIIIFDRVLSDANRKLIEQYLGQKYGIATFG